MADEGGDVPAEGSPDEAPVDQGGAFEVAPRHVNDWFLQELIELAEMGVEQSITLTIGGSHLYGKLIGGSQYFEEIVRSYQTGNYSEDARVLQRTLINLFQSHADAYPKKAEDRLPLGESFPNYIHLRDARWHSLDGKTMPGNGTYWRGKVSAVDGFMLGELRVERD